MRKNKGWKVSIDRPEELLGNPAIYYTDDEVERYARSGGMRRAQEAIAERIIELLEIDKGKILDLGCGAGYTAEVYKKLGFEVVGLDVLPNMLEKAKEKKLNLVLGDMKQLKMLFNAESFDFVVSASALQWIKEKDDIKKVAEGIYYVLKKAGKFAIQFYPRTEEELINVGRIFKKEGFEGNIVTDSPENPRKRQVYLIMRKEVKK